MLAREECREFLLYMFRDRSNIAVHKTQRATLRPSQVIDLTRPEGAFESIRSVCRESCEQGAPLLPAGSRVESAPGSYFSRVGSSAPGSGSSAPTREQIGSRPGSGGGSTVLPGGSTGSPGWEHGAPGTREKRRSRLSAPRSAPGWSHVLMPAGSARRCRICSPRRRHPSNGRHCSAPRCPGPRGEQIRQRRHRRGGVLPGRDRHCSRVCSRVGSEKLLKKEVWPTAPGWCSRVGASAPGSGSSAPGTREHPGISG